MSVNIERLKQVREFIAKLPDEACDMTSWQRIAYGDGGESKVTFAVMKENGFECGSAACIAGWTEIMVNEKTREEAIDNGVPIEYIEADKWLGLNYGEREDLFLSFPDYPEGGWKEWMLARLDKCIDAGRIVPLTLAEGRYNSEDPPEDDPDDDDDQENE